MKKELRDAWCAGLRGGKYKQGSGHLRTNSDSYCCMGVLCLVAGRKLRPAQGALPGVKGGYVPKKWLTRYEQSALVGQNDCERKGFAEIADWIEQNVPVTP